MRASEETSHHRKFQRQHNIMITTFSSRETEEQHFNFLTETSSVYIRSFNNNNINNRIEF
jgi:hypothetical protein